MEKALNEDPIEGALQQGVNKKEYTNALLQKKKVKKKIKKRMMKSFGFKWHSPPKIIIKIENHFHSTVDSVHQ